MGRMSWLTLLLPLLTVSVLRAEDLAVSNVPLTIDGVPEDPFWRDVSWRKLAPAETGVPADLGGEVRVAMRGSYLCFAARLPEPGGRVLARSIGRNPIWEKDAVESSEVEDRIRLRVHYGGRDSSVEVNPWGAYRVEGRADILPAARIHRDGWTVEIAWKLEPYPTGEIQLEAERIRSRRALAPEFLWRWGIQAGLGAGAAIAAPEFRPPELGNSSPPFEIGRVSKLPPVTARWDEPAWSGVREIELLRNEPFPRAPRYATRVKWLHDGKKLALLFRMDEPEPVVARSGGRDSNVTSDDHVAIYLATSGSSFLEIAVNTVGAIRDSRGSGPHIMRPSTSWNARIERQTDIRHGYWVARIDIPLDECAAALGETGVPKDWRILIARTRAARPGEAAESSSLPVVGAASTFYGPARYQRMILTDRESASAAAVSKSIDPARIESRVWSPMERRHAGVRTMLARHLERQVEQAVLAERRAWESVKTHEDWERFRDERLRGLRESIGEYPPERPPLDARVTSRRDGRGYRLENVVFQSRRGFWMSGNLYLPGRAGRAAPAIIIVHSQHYPKTQGELHDMGELWARTGCVVLVMERPGYGERVETTPWYRQSYASRHTFTKQLFLVGESYSGWAAWDIIRSVDYLYERPEVDRQRIILLGSVAGGGEPSALAAALDSRITAVAPFNYDQGHVRVHGDSPGQIARQFSPWLVAASVAPRKFIRAFEFAWEGAEEADYPNLWVDGMQRSEKVWGFYNARENLASSQAYGLIRLSMERVSHCFSIGPQQREELYPALQRWFGIPFPEPEDRNIAPDSQLSTNPEREQARRQEAQRRRPHAELLSISPAINAQIDRKKMHQIAWESAGKSLRAARARRNRSVRDDLRPLLGDIDPARSAQAETLWTKPIPGAEVAALSMSVEEGIRVPLLMIRPLMRETTPVVVAVAQGGKERFLSGRRKEIDTLAGAGISVVLADVRGTGETSASPDGTPVSLAQMAFDLNRSLVGSRLKDLRTVLDWLRRHPGIDRRRMAVWGESFAPANPADLFVDEIEFEVAPQPQFRADPLGAHLALLAGLYEEDVRAVAARGGLAGYQTVLDDAFTYVPMDVIVHGILKYADIPDIAADIAPRPVLMDRMVNGRNIAVGPGAQAADVSQWLIGKLSGTK